MALNFCGIRNTDSDTAKRDSFTYDNDEPTPVIPSISYSSPPARSILSALASPPTSPSRNIVSRASQAPSKQLFKSQNSVMSHERGAEAAKEKFGGRLIGTGVEYGSNNYGKGIRTTTSYLSLPMRMIERNRPLSTSSSISNATTVSISAPSISPTFQSTSIVVAESIYALANLSTSSSIIAGPNRFQAPTISSTSAARSRSVRSTSSGIDIITTTATFPSTFITKTAKDGNRRDTRSLNTNSRGSQSREMRIGMGGGSLGSNSKSRAIGRSSPVNSTMSASSSSRGDIIHAKKGVTSVLYEGVGKNGLEI